MHSLTATMIVNHQDKCGIARSAWILSYGSILTYYLYHNH
jgi:hypothetical protein